MTTRFTGPLAEIAAVAGEPAALVIAARKGGRTVYIPAQASDAHWLVDCVGRAKADLICRHFSVDGRGARIDLPMGDGGVYPQLRRAVAKRVHELDGRQESASKIAGAVGITTRTVHRHRRAHRGGNGGPQGSLF